MDFQKYGSFVNNPQGSRNIFRSNFTGTILNTFQLSLKLRNAYNLYLGRYNRIYQILEPYSAQIQVFITSFSATFCCWLLSFYFELYETHSHYVHPCPLLLGTLKLTLRLDVICFIITDVKGVGELHFLKIKYTLLLITFKYNVANVTTCFSVDSSLIIQVYLRRPTDTEH